MNADTGQTTLTPPRLQPAGPSVAAGVLDVPDAAALLVIAAEFAGAVQAAAQLQAVADLAVELPDALAYNPGDPVMRTVMALADAAPDAEQLAGFTEMLAQLQPVLLDQLNRNEHITADGLTGNITSHLPTGSPEKLTPDARDERAPKRLDHCQAGEQTMTPPDPSPSAAPAPPPAPAAEKLHELREWGYTGNVASRRPLRLWRTARGRRDTLLAIVSERPDDEGTSITNAAEKIVAKLKEEHPYSDVEVIEHLVDRGGRHRYSRIEIDADGHPTWTPVPGAELAARLGPGFDTSEVLTPLPEGVLSPHQTQDIPPVKWSYQTLKLDPTSVPLADAETASETLARYAYDKADRFDPIRMAEPAVNATLRGTLEATTQRQNDIAVLDQTLQASRIERPITVYRGFTSGMFVLPADWRERDLTGLQWSNPAYTSTTSDADYAEAYVGEIEERGFAVRLHLPAGTPAIAIQDEAGGADDEGEIVLPRGLTFQVTTDRGIQGNYGIRWLDVTATLPPASDNAPAHAPGDQGTNA